MSHAEQKEQGADWLIEQMDSVRSAGFSHVHELQREAKRLVDWKEYVLTKPLASIAVSSLLGFVITRSTMRAATTTKPQSSNAKNSSASIAARNSTLTGRALNFGTSLATAAIKSYVASLLKGVITERSTDDRLQKFDSKVKDSA